MTLEDYKARVAVRETREEIGVTPVSLRQVATLDFYFIGIADPREWDPRSGRRVSAEFLYEGSSAILDFAVTAA